MPPWAGGTGAVGVVAVVVAVVVVVDVDVEVEGVLELVLALVLAGVEVECEAELWDALDAPDDAGAVDRLDADEVVLLVPELATA